VIRKQLSLDLEFKLAEAASINTLAPGDRFIRAGREGQVVRISEGSATVKILNQDQKWERIQWSPSTLVQKMSA
jgi:hypothetical protein